jgi:hypothetical protein
LATIALIGVIPARCLASDAAGAVLFFILPSWPNCERLREIANDRERLRVIAQDRGRLRATESDGITGTKKMNE